MGHLPDYYTFEEKQNVRLWKEPAICIMERAGPPKQDDGLERSVSIKDKYGMGTAYAYDILGAVPLCSTR